MVAEPTEAMAEFNQRLTWVEASVQDVAVIVKRLEERAEKVEKEQEVDLNKLDDFSADFDLKLVKLQETVEAKGQMLEKSI